jgi:hypothetical protein
LLKPSAALVLIRRLIIAAARYRASAKQWSIYLQENDHNQRGLQDKHRQPLYRDRSACTSAEEYPHDQTEQGEINNEVQKLAIMNIAKKAPSDNNKAP